MTPDVQLRMAFDFALLVRLSHPSERPSMRAWLGVLHHQCQRVRGRWQSASLHGIRRNDKHRRAGFVFSCPTPVHLLVSDASPPWTELLSIRKVPLMLRWFYDSIFPIVQSKNERLHVWIVFSLACSTCVEAKLAVQHVLKLRLHSWSLWLSPAALLAF